MPPPVQGDVWLRLLYRMLPVNSRFYYLQPSQPTAVCCAYGCGAVETEHHAFHTSTPCGCSMLEHGSAMVSTFHGPPSVTWICFTSTSVVPR